MRNGAPEDACRTTKMSACIAERFAIVSSSDSPLVCELTATFRLITSADRRLAAISKVVRVRVAASKERVNKLLSRKSGTFFTSRSVTPTKEAAVSRMRSIVSRGSPSIDRRCCNSPCALSCGLRCTFQLELEPAFGAALEPQPLACGHLHAGAAVLRADRE